MGLRVLVKRESISRSVVSSSLRPHGLTWGILLCPQNSPEKNYRNGLPFPSPGDLPDPRIKPRSPALQADSLVSEPPGKPQGFGNRIQIYFLGRMTL